MRKAITAERNAKVAPAPDPIGEVPIGTYRPKFGLVVICASEDEQKALYDRLRDLGLTPRVVTV